MHFHADSSEPTVNPGTIAGMSTAACPVRATVRSSFHWERGKILAFSFASRGKEAPSMLWIPCLQLDGHGGSRTESPDYFVRAKRPFCAAHCFFPLFSSVFLTELLLLTSLRENLRIRRAHVEHVAAAHNQEPSRRPPSTVYRGEPNVRQGRAAPM